MVLNSIIYFFLEIDTLINTAYIFLTPEVELYYFNLMLLLGGSRLSKTRGRAKEEEGAGQGRLLRRWTVGKGAGGREERRRVLFGGKPGSKEERGGGGGRVGG